MALPFWELDDELDNEEQPPSGIDEVSEVEATATIPRLGLPFMPTLSPKAAAAYQVLQDLFKQDAPACKEADSDLFFPERGASTREVKSICQACFARADCLEYALVASEKFGIWGGTSEKERRKLRRERNAKKKQRVIEAKTLSESIDSFKLPTVVPPLVQQQTTSTPAPSPCVTDSELSKDEIGWFKKLTGDKSRSKAIYASYKSGTHLAQSDQSSWIRYQPIPRPAPIRRPAKQHQDDSVTKKEDWMIKNGYPTETEEDDYLVEICVVLAKLGGRIKDQEGFATRQLRDNGLDYPSLGTDLKAAEDTHLIRREISGKRTYLIELTSRGRSLTGSQATEINQEEGSSVVEEPPTSLINPDASEEQAPEPATPELPAPEEIDATNQPFSTAGLATELILQMREFEEDLIYLAKQLEKSEQDRAEKEKRYSALVAENARLKQILSSFNDKLQEALAEGS